MRTLALTGVTVVLALLAALVGTTGVAGPAVAGPTPPGPTRARGEATAAPGVVSTFADPGMGRVGEVTTAADGSVWFVNDTRSVGRITPGGAITIFQGLDRPGEPRDIVAGPDGAVWFTVRNPHGGGGGWIRRITDAGATTDFELGPTSMPDTIAVGADGELWFSDGGFDLEPSLSKMTTGGQITTGIALVTVARNGLVAGADGTMWFVTAGAPSQLQRIPAVSPDWPYPTTTFPVGAPVRQLTTGPGGDVWFTTTTNGVGTVSAAGAVTLFTDPSISAPTAITTGPDGALWFTNVGNDSIGRITTTGTASHFGVPSVAAASSIVAGADGALWFTDADTHRVNRMTTAGVVTPFARPGTGVIGAITRGPDDALWFLNGEDSIGRITTAGAITTFFDPAINQPGDITAGPDGALWFTNVGAGSIGRMSTAGSVTTFPGHVMLAAAPIVLGPDGALWFSEVVVDTDDGQHQPYPPIGVLGRITPAGAASRHGTFVQQPSIPFSIAAGRDGALWFAGSGFHYVAAKGQFVDSGFVGKIPLDPPDEDGNLPFRDLDDDFFVHGLIRGPDGAMWVTDGRTVLSVADDLSVSPVALAPSAAAQDLVEGPDGAAWSTTWYADHDAIVRIRGNGATEAFTDPAIVRPASVTPGPDGAIWFVNIGTRTIGRITTAAPGAPTGVTAVAGNERATVTWTNPIDTGSSPLTDAAVVASPGGATCLTAASTPQCTVVGLTNGVAYTFTVEVRNDAASGPRSQPSPAVIPQSAAAGFHPIGPGRILDSRTTVGGWNAPLAAGSERSLVVASGAVPASASAVVLNVTVTEGSAGSYLKVWPTGWPSPVASNVNFAPGQTIPNLVTVQIGEQGRVSFANNVGSVHVVADLVGYYDDGNGPGAGYTATTPTRFLDSRTATGGWSGRLAAASARDVDIVGGAAPALVPSSATAVVANVTATDSTAGSFLQGWTSGGVRPTTGSNLNFGVGETVANMVVIPIGANGKISLATAVGATHVVVDVVGYFASTGARFHAMSPRRVLDDRVGVGASGPWGPNQEQPVAVTGTPGIPAGATAAVVNLTATNGTAGSFLTLFPALAARPGASTLPFGPGQTIANLAVTRLSAGGQLAIANHLGTVDVIADVVGYYA
jgi:streptogramin lyase